MTGTDQGVNYILNYIIQRVINWFRVKNLQYPV